MHDPIFTGRREEEPFLCPAVTGCILRVCLAAGYPFCHSQPERESVPCDVALKKSREFLLRLEIVSWKADAADLSYLIHHTHRLQRNFPVLPCIDLSPDSLYKCLKLVFQIAFTCFRL